MVSIHQDGMRQLPLVRLEDTKEHRMSLAMHQIDLVSTHSETYSSIHSKYSVK